MSEQTPLNYESPRPPPPLAFSWTRFISFWLVFAVFIIVGWVIEEKFEMRLRGHPGDKGIVFLHGFGALLNAIFLLAIYFRIIRRLRPSLQIAIAATGGVLSFPTGLAAFYLLAPR